MKNKHEVLFIDKINGLVKTKDKTGELYLLSNEDIKEGFEGFAIVTVKDDSRIKYLVEVILTEKNQCYCRGDRKFPFEFYKVNAVIITTDSFLLKPYSEQTLNDIATVASPTPEFIQKWVLAYDADKLIKWVEVEYTDNGEEGWFGDDYNGEPVWNEKWELKVNSQNQVEIMIPVISIQEQAMKWGTRKVSESKSDIDVEELAKEYTGEEMSRDDKRLFAILCSFGKKLQNRKQEKLSLKELCKQNTELRNEVIELINKLLREHSTSVYNELNGKNTKTFNSTEWISKNV